MSGYELAENEIFLGHGNSGDWGSCSAVWVEWSAIKGMLINYNTSGRRSASNLRIGVILIAQFHTARGPGTTGFSRTFCKAQFQMAVSQRLVRNIDQYSLEESS